MLLETIGNRGDAGRLVCPSFKSLGGKEGEKKKWLWGVEFRLIRNYILEERSLFVAPNTIKEIPIFFQYISI